MRAILASLKPYYYYLVGEGIKEVEVRKSIPKSNDWDKKVFFYMSKDEKSFAKIPKEYQEKYRRHFGKVGLQFICDKITPLFSVATTSWNLLAGNVHDYAKGLVRMARLTEKEMHDYAKGKNCFAWRISDLKIYDKPKELSEFRKYYECGNNSCGSCDKCDRDWHLTRPPQSWFYVED